MPKHRDPKRQQLILDKAMLLFAERGFYGVTVKDIAFEADIGLGSVYTYFESKEQLANELYQHWKGRFSAALGTGLTPSLKGRKAHRTLWTNLAQFVKDHTLAFLFLETQHHANYLDSTSIAIEQQTYDFALRFYQDDLCLDLSNDQAQLVISASFGALVQVTKAAVFGRLAFTDDTFLKLECSLWQIACQPSP